MKQWHIIYCDAKSKVCPITDFLDTLALKHQVKTIRFLKLLEEMGPSLPRPYADILRDGIHELRISLSGEPVRILYFFYYEFYIILYHVLRKHTDRVPEKDIEETRHYRQKFKNRVSPDYLEGLGYAFL